MSKLNTKKKGAPDARKATDDPETEAAFALLGREFVRLIRSERRPASGEQAAALKLVEWIFDHRLTKTEQKKFRLNTGWLFDSDLAADDPLRLTTHDPAA